MKKFGEYIKEKREEHQLDQAQIKGFNGPYISEIERGIKFPTRKGTIEKLAKALYLDTSEKFINWLWMYSLIDQDPVFYFHPNGLFQTPVSSVNETPNHLYNTDDEINIHLNSTEQDVINRLGPPDKKIRVPSRCKWIYEKEGLHVIFTDGKVTDIAFK